MKNRARSAVVGLLLASTLSGRLAGGATATPAPPLPKSVDSLAWIVGCWERTNAEKGSGEDWKRAGDRLAAKSRTINGGRVGEYEDLEIRKEGDGLVYAARPNGRPETLFRLTSAGKDFAVFENPLHDFPKKISYRRSGETMTARIEGAPGTKPGAIDYPFKAKPCK